MSETRKLQSRGAVLSHRKREIRFFSISKMWVAGIECRKNGQVEPNILEEELTND